MTSGGRMMDMSLLEEIFEKTKRLNIEDQRIVLGLVDRLSRPRGESGKSLKEHARKINFPKEDLAEIAEAIKDFDNIEPDKEINLDARNVST
jgi:hypothetical protein